MAKFNQAEYDKQNAVYKAGFEYAKSLFFDAITTIGDSIQGVDQLEMTGPVGTGMKLIADIVLREPAPNLDPGDMK